MESSIQSNAAMPSPVVTVGPPKEEGSARSDNAAPLQANASGPRPKPHGKAPAAQAGAAFENRLAQVRLGVVSSLFASLRAKHAPTAAHCLRVALISSAWARGKNMSEEERDKLEVAALMHDIGKIGVPDNILLKPGSLTEEEAPAMRGHSEAALEILGFCCPSREILDIIQYAPAWYDGSRQGYAVSGDRLPLGSRMVAIVDAFDAMTTDQVYRRALSRERAMAELFAHAGEQFDMRLVKEFCNLLAADELQLTAAAARQWLTELDPDVTNSRWRRGQPAARGLTSIDSLFQEKLLENMHDAVLFIDSNLKIVQWNRAAERLTGVPRGSVQQRQWTPSLVRLQDENGHFISEDDCPFAYVMKSGVQALRRLHIQGRNQQNLSVDVHIVPVSGQDGLIYGATVVMHDASSQITLEERVQTLQTKATRDPLTGCANRAEFDRVLEQFIDIHLESAAPCSLIICDIDHFKKINDTFGHQAGDEALISFAGLLKRLWRPGDLVARYGGEEFCALCADCDNTTAAERAEGIRSELAATQQPMLSGKCITASFGVTEIQEGDTAETMLRRADRALLQAKETGRNRVVQLGGGFRGGDEMKAPSKGGWFSWFGRSEEVAQLLERVLATSVPAQVAVEKLCGFVADHGAEIVSSEDNCVKLTLDAQNDTLLRRRNDRAVPFGIELQFLELTPSQRPAPGVSTLIKVSIRPRRGRDRRREDALERARQLMASLKSYLMAHDYNGPIPGEK